ncbi:hypothetical protein JNUCC32_31415 (plasmid) [Paenibacillus sp. JNUCC32]|uniref:hypothetical protein n=1 Tax=Paenibacillus sp. JNUCC32 TaxID=2777984 RepID=UPI0017883D26|nr:hypothetical protein [Paenibacillus sp. JNUCC-32]QOT13708.1 hypothetical protein JNUCC32_31415 [Paenibacillus sp. JNUCC-32]
MRKVEIRGYVVYDPEEVASGDLICGRIEDMLFNEDYPREWSFEAVSDTEVPNEEEVVTSEQ